MYRAIVETPLEVNLKGIRLRLEPLLPKNWSGFQIHYRYRQCVYRIAITRLSANAPETNVLILGGEKLPGPTLPLHDDRREHIVKLFVRG